MIVRLAKDYKHYEILYESQEEAQAVVDYQEQMLARGTLEMNRRWQAEFQHEQETSTG